MEPAGGVSDAELLAAHVAGDPEAFTSLISRHRDRMWAVALRTTGDPDDAADALQDALISAFRGADRFRGDSAVTTWLHRIVVNASLDRRRRNSVRYAVSLPDESLGGEGALVDARDRIAEREDQIEIAAALSELPRHQREAVLLVDVEGWTIEEAAGMLGCPPGTIKSRCSRGRVKLASKLGHLRKNVRERNPEGPGSVKSPKGGDEG